MCHWQPKKLNNISNMSRDLPKLLLHCCCAPCTTSVLERLTPDYEIFLFFYNPNIDTVDEYNKRSAEMYKIPNIKSIIISDYFKADFIENTDCATCYELRLRKTASIANNEGYDFFTTTLSVSPYKDASLLNKIGSFIAGEYEGSGLRYLNADFKKNDGFKRSVELSKMLGLYRQNYCGCHPRE